MQEIQHSQSTISEEGTYNSSEIFRIAKILFKFDLALQKSEWLLHLESLQVQYRKKQTFKNKDMVSNVNYILDSEEYNYIDKYRGFYDKCCHRIRGVLRKHYSDKKNGRYYSLSLDDVNNLLTNELYRFFINKSLEVNSWRKQELIEELDDCKETYATNQYRLYFLEKFEKKLALTNSKEAKNIVLDVLAPDEIFRNNWYDRISLERKRSIIRKDITRINAIIGELNEIKASKYKKKLFN